MVSRASWGCSDQGSDVGKFAMIMTGPEMLLKVEPYAPLIPAQAGIQQSSQRIWVPAFAGTNGKIVATQL